ncbi:CapA family protein [Clostridium massiliodielmoense]|uniref:CapA family protein n=1 Tax=Clostridium massiliodielmoense TaxID=1776385 RepID=UPI001FA86753|nr:CapA family protein [Clostridium massiliodielmoense]
MESAFKFMAFGDCLLENKFINSLNFKDICKILNTNDFITFNLETTVSGLEGKKKDKAFNFKTGYDNLYAFKNSINCPIICNIANNHIFDYGEECFIDTIENLNKSNIYYTGYSSNLDIEQGVICVNINNTKIAFIGAYNGDNVSVNNIGLTSIKNIHDKVIYAKKIADLVILHLHWGEELSLCQSPRQVNIAHKLVDLGADIIIGHHPHVIQAIEEYKDSLIIYSLGNFQIVTSDVNDKYSHIIQVFVDRSRKINYKLIPVIIKNTIPNALNKINDEHKNYKKIVSLNKYYLENCTWINFYCEAVESFFSDSFSAWRLRKLKKEKNLYFKFIRWCMTKKVITMFFVYLFNKMFRIKEKNYEKIS